MLVEGEVKVRENALWTCVQLARVIVFPIELLHEVSKTTSFDFQVVTKDVFG